MMGAIQVSRIIVAIAPKLGPISSNSSSGNPDDFLPRRTQTNHANSHHLSLPKPSFLVRTQSNVRREIKRKPEPSCVVCEGSGRVDCHHCRGRGRTNYTDLIMLPRGEWPKWCKTCGGSGLGYCTRCLGTGEYRDIMGFRFMKRESNHPPQHTKLQVEGNDDRLVTNVDLHVLRTPSEVE